jgi:hypothetical protein
MSQNSGFYKNNIPSSLGDAGAEGYGIVVFGAVMAIPYSGRSIFFFNSKLAGTMEYRNDFVFLRQPQNG